MTQLKLSEISLVLVVIFSAATILAACDFSVTWMNVPINQLEPEVKNLAQTYITASRAGDAETVAAHSVVFESGEYHSQTAQEIELAMSTNRGFWNYTDYSLDAVYTLRRSPGVAWKIPFTLYYASGRSTQNEIVIQRFNGDWKVSRLSIDPKLLRSLGE